MGVKVGVAVGSGVAVGVDVGGTVGVFVGGSGVSVGAGWGACACCTACASTPGAGATAASGWTVASADTAPAGSTTRIGVGVNVGIGVRVGSAPPKKRQPESRPTSAEIASTMKAVLNGAYALTVLGCEISTRISRLPPPGQGDVHSEKLTNTGAQGSQNRPYGSPSGIAPQTIEVQDCFHGRPRHVPATTFLCRGHGLTWVRPHVDLAS